MRYCKKLLVVLASFFIISSSIFFLSGCDMIQFTGPVGPQGEKGDKGDKGDPGEPGKDAEPVEEPEEIIEEPDFLVGERYTKFYLVPDASVQNDTLTASSLSIQASAIDPNYGVGYNQLTLHDVPLLSLINKTPFNARATGTVAASGRHSFVDRTSTIHYHGPFAGSAPFDQSITVTADAIIYEPTAYNLVSSFKNKKGDLILSKTEEYSQEAVMNSSSLFKVTVPASVLKSITGTTFPHQYCMQRVNDGTNWGLNSCGAMESSTDTTYETDMTVDFRVDTPHTLVSRDFYQYRNITVTYPSDISVFDITQSEIVKSFEYDEASNTITVIFNEYDTPYSGDILSYTIVDDNGKQEEKTIRIAE